MSTFICPHCGEATEIFRKGGGARTAEELGVPFLGEIPIDPEVTVGGDEGVPIVARNPASATAQAFGKVAGEVARQLSIANTKKAGLDPGFKLQWK